MICPRCGKSAEEGWENCPYCGAPLQQPPQPEASAPRYTQSPVPDPAPAGTPQEPPVIQLMRRAARSPAFLVPAIAYTCMVVCNLISTLGYAVPGAMDGYLNQLTGYGMDGQMASVYGMLSTVPEASAGGSLVGQIPSILMAVGIWITFASAVDTSGGPIKTAGLTIIRVIQIIVLVLVGVLCLLLLGVMGLSLTAVGAFGYGDSTAGIAFVLFLVFAGIVVLAILYSVKTITTIDGFRRSIWTGKPQGKISVYVAVISILGGLLSLTSALTGNVFSALAGVASAVSGVGFGVFLFQYRDWLRSLEQQDTDAPGTYTYNAQP